MIISFEGIDGSGKSTQVKLAKEYLESIGYDVILIREPGTSSESEQIRNLIFNTNVTIDTERLLFLASMVQNSDMLVKPNHGKRAIILYDRYIHSTIAYQGKETEKIIKVLLGNGTLSRPDYVICYDVFPETSMKRLAERGAEGQNKYDLKDRDFYNKIRENYRKALKKDYINKYYIYIDGDNDLDTVTKETKNILTQIIESEIGEHTLIDAYHNKDNPRYVLQLSHLNSLYFLSIYDREENKHSVFLKTKDWDEASKQIAKANKSFLRNGRKWNKMLKKHDKIKQ